MKATTYDVEATTEATHWWFVGRRILFNRMIERLGVASQARVLDIEVLTLKPTRPELIGCPRDT